MDSGSAGDPRESQAVASPPVLFIQQPAAQQPEVTILQQMPWTPPSLPLSNRGGRIKEDLMDLMMLQNAQMHQVMMHHLAMSALASFGLSPAQPAAQVSPLPWQVEDDDPEPLIFHHHYTPCPNALSLAAWQRHPQPQPSAWPQPTIRHVGLDPQLAAREDDSQVVPPPPPPSATGTVTADVPPASEYYDFTQGRF